MKELKKHIENRINEEEQILKGLFGIEIKEFDITQLSNVITRCNFLIALKYQKETNK